MRSQQGWAQYRSGTPTHHAQTPAFPVSLFHASREHPRITSQVNPVPWGFPESQSCHVQVLCRHLCLWQASRIPILELLLQMTTNFVEFISLQLGRPEV
jgi:hypothetical protein